MANRVIVTSEKLTGNYYEIGFLTKEDNKNYQFKFISNKVLTDREIKTKLETITDCYVESIKRVTKYKRIRQNIASDRGVSLVGRYTLNGEKVRTDTLFLPLVPKNYVEMGTLENQLKEFFGSDFEINVYSPR